MCVRVRVCVLGSARGGHSSKLQVCVRAYVCVFGGKGEGAIWEVVGFNPPKSCVCVCVHIHISVRILFLGGGSTVANHGSELLRSIAV